MPDEHQHNRREDFRIVDVLFMREQQLSDAEMEARKKGMSMSSRLSNVLHSMLPMHVELKHAFQHGDEPTGLISAIEVLDAKLNYLVGISMLNEAESHQMKETTVNVSSTGMSFFSDQPHKVGDYLHVVLVVPTAPPQMMDLLAEVKWARHEEGQRRVGIGFCFRSMEERDSLARYVFRRHREMIRLQEKGA